MTISEVAALAAVVLSIGTNVGLYIHLSSTMNTRFDTMESKLNSKFASMENSMNSKFASIERRLEMI